MTLTNTQFTNLLNSLPYIGADVTADKYRNEIKDQEVEVGEYLIFLNYDFLIEGEMDTDTDYFAVTFEEVSDIEFHIFFDYENTEEKVELNKQQTEQLIEKIKTLIYRI